MRIVEQTCHDSSQNCICDELQEMNGSSTREALSLPTQHQPNLNEGSRALVLGKECEMYDCMPLFAEHEKMGLRHGSTSSHSMKNNSIVLGHTLSRGIMTDTPPLRRV